MSEKILFLEIFQSFAQYRNPFTFYYAQTYPLPPKSTIIGMLQNAVEDWYGNKYGVEKWWDLKVSIHGGFESVFWNYQNLVKGYVEFDKNMRLINQKLPLYGEGLTSKREPVYQQELFNGHLYIFISGEDAEIINKIKEALEKPKKVLSLGRSEDIIFIRDIKLLEKGRNSEPAEGDIKLTFPTYIMEKNFPINMKKYPVYSIPVKIIFKNGNFSVKNKSEITKSTKREVEFERVIYTGYEYSILLKEGETVNVEVYKVREKEIRIIENYGWL